MGEEHDGELVLQPDPRLPVYDCRIEWKNGSAERNTAKMWLEIERIVKSMPFGPAPAIQTAVPSAPPQQEAQVPAQPESSGTLRHDKEALKAFENLSPPDEKGDTTY